MATRITGDVGNNVIANWASGYVTLVYYGAWANLMNNYYTGSHKVI